MLAEWRSDGWVRDDVEVWSIAIPGTGAGVGTFAAGSTEACFEDNASVGVFSKFGGVFNDLAVVDRLGQVAFKMYNLQLGNAGTRSDLDSRVRALLTN